MPVGSNLVIEAVQPAEGTFQVEAVGREPPEATSRFEQQALASLPTGSTEAIGPLKADAKVDASLPALPPIAPDHVRLALKLSPDSHETMLLIQNSYARPIHFRVSLTMPDGKPAPSEQETVCPVAAGGRSVEYWRSPMTQLAIHSLIFLSYDRSRWRCF